MAVFNQKVEEFKEELRTDTTLNTAVHYARTAPKKFVPAATQYLLEKVPIVQWLPRYSPTWLMPDAIAGLTIGVMLIPQGLAYAQIATIPIENGLYSSWVPAAVAVFMGTSKGQLANLHTPLLNKFLSIHRSFKNINKFHIS